MMNLQQLKTTVSQSARRCKAYAQKNWPGFKEKCAGKWGFAWQYSRTTWNTHWPNVKNTCKAQWNRLCMAIARQLKNHSSSKQ